MDTGKPTKTLADYLVMAVSPVLIMVLVHSVCFFLVDVFYRGEAVGGVRWVLFWFVLAVVLIARIGIEQGDGPAMAYGLALAVVTWGYLFFVQPNAVFGALLLGIVWFMAHKITCNCTLVDDEVDASGQGLMQSLRRPPALVKKSSPSARMTVRLPGAAIASSPAEKKKKSSSSAAPGVWLIYFSLAALPSFGLGQTLLPAGDTAARHRGFVHLFFYLAAALGLLISTSFLGLRRYLRQRYVAMPGKIARGWLQFGVAGALVVLCASLLLPRPGAGAAWGALRYQVDYQVRRASQFAARFNPPGRGSGRAGDQSPPNGQPENQPPQGGQTAGPSQSDESSGKGQGGQQSGSIPAPGGSSGQGGVERPETPPPAVSPAAGPLHSWLKLLFYLAAISGILWLMYRYRAVVASMLRSAWGAICDFIEALLALFRPAAATPKNHARRIEVPPFRAFKNPFLTGTDRIWPAEQLIVYTYDALQSWALEKEAPASPRTPREFCRQLGEEMPQVAEALEHLAFLYGHVAYGASVPGACNLQHLRLIWHYLALPHVKDPRTPDSALVGNE